MPFKGWSVVAAQRIERGQFVSEYLGEVISMAEARRRETQQRAARSRANYILVLREWLYASFLPRHSLELTCSASCDRILCSAVDATSCGNLSRFVSSY